MSWIKGNLERLKSLVLRDDASPEFIAKGWAIGMFYGCTIPFGFQLMLSVPTAFILKGSRLGATVGTFVTNHFTIFLIYPVQCWIGNRLLGGNLSYTNIAHALQDVVAEQSWEAVLQVSGELLEAFFLGGIVLAAVFTPLTSGAVRAYVRRHRWRMDWKEAPRHG